MAALTNKQQAFVREYLVDLNATQAAIRAGYSEKAARFVGSENLTKPNIQAAVAQAISERSESTKITAAYVLTNLQEVVERCMQRAPVLDRRGEQVQDAEGNNLWTFNGKVAVSALNLLGNHLGMFKERHEHSGANGGPLEYVEIVLSAADGNHSGRPGGTVQLPSGAIPSLAE